MKEFQIITHWSVDELSSLAVINLPQDAEDVFVFRIFNFEEGLLPMNPIHDKNGVILDEGHDFRVRGRKLVSSNADIFIYPVLIQWGKDKLSSCLNSHQFKDQGYNFCPECGIPL